MSPVRLNGSTSGYSELSAPAVAGDQTFLLPSTGGTLDRLNRAGNILQVVNVTYNTSASNSTSTYADTGLTASITPTSATSKVLVVVNQAGLGKNTGNAYMGIKLMRGSTDLILFEGEGAYSGDSLPNSVGSASCAYLDSPSTTASVTYKTQFRSIPNTAQVIVQSSSSASTITLMEVAA